MNSPPPAEHYSAEIQTVAAWHEALNSGDVERLLKLSHPDIEVGGPRGTAHGTQILREWVDRANIQLEPRRNFQKADTVIVEQEAEWQSAEPGGRQTVASVFVVRDGLVMSVVRYSGLPEALGAVNLEESLERNPDGSMDREDRVFEDAIRETLTTAPLNIRRYEPSDRQAVRSLHDDALERGRRTSGER
jgi:ketosteroid isomerase-like protein